LKAIWVIRDYYWEEAFSRNLYKNFPWNLECFVEDLFLGGQWSIILGYRRLSVKSLLVEDENWGNPGIHNQHFQSIFPKNFRNSFIL
jgi:hypothetical protein